MPMMTTRLRRGLLIWVCLLGITATRVSAQTPAVPSDKLAWTQSVSSGSAASYSFAILVDGTRAVLPNVTCTGDTSLECSAALPAMTPGRHEVRIVAIYTADAVTAESAPSEALVLTFVVIASPTGLRLIKG